MWYEAKENSNLSGNVADLKLIANQAGTAGAWNNHAVSVEKGKYYIIVAGQYNAVSGDVEVIWNKYIDAMSVPTFTVLVKANTTGTMTIKSNGCGIMVFGY